MPCDVQPVQHQWVAATTTFLAVYRSAAAATACPAVAAVASAVGVLHLEYH